MSKVKIGSKTWVIVCDGAHSLFLRNDGNEHVLNLVEVYSGHHPLKATHELGVDRPGRVYASKGGARSSVEASDLHLKAEEEFAANVGDRLEEHMRSGAMSRFILIAPPRMLAFLRTHMKPAVEDAMKASLAKDLTKLTLHEIEAHLQDGPDM